MNREVPDFNARGFALALERLGFKDVGKGRHQYKFKHRNRLPITPGTRPFIVFPHDIRRDKNFQKALVRTLIRDWGFTEGEVFKALK
ncbi:MAG: hypothetical protein A3F35_00660 [Candidatus Woykebacteria bacterium RIFCSPHIGHO2_12_FULL_45_10]|uniref:Toxin HicA n=1 Tax=Candidatus Woykebacteria bacterium RIFCSPHIGHO2_12_FULL_45_10 TaxID=1802603 RepID=A0A1G1WR53_9BACT|nr:MAG: hypothetical protein A3F35_00660 [Candidatus Woykebacteria bacterium RIFCSPHIGHO2_12_FULL_45_10]